MRRFVQILSSLLITVIAVSARSDEWSLIVRLNRAVDQILPADAKVEKLAGDFGYLEGPVWVRSGGYLLFSDIPANVIYKWSSATKKVTVFLPYSGYTGTDDSKLGGQSNNGRTLVTLIGSNAVTLDPKGRVVFCAHGDRQVVRLEPNGQRTVLASSFEGKRLNSPNDLVFKADGSLYFTDPSTGLREKDKGRELSFNGVYLFKDGKLQVLTKDFPHPNGLAFSPDEKYLYVNDSQQKTITRFDVLPDDTVANPHVIIDMSSDKGEGAPDGMKVDVKGNIYCTGPGGLWIMSPDGTHIGTILNSQRPSNLAFGGPDRKTLFFTARMGLYQIRLKIPGTKLAGMEP